MELRTVVTYLGSLAHYAITPDNFGVYHARLLKYEGQERSTPPQSFILVRGEDRWVSSCPKQRFINQMGKAIERRVREGDPHSF